MTLNCEFCLFLFFFVLFLCCFFFFFKRIKAKIKISLQTIFVNKLHDSNPVVSVKYLE